MIDIFLRFESEKEAREVAAAITGHPPAEAFVKDGWVRDTYFSIDVVFGTGIVIDPETGLPFDGFHINGRWRGPEETIPEELNLYRVYPETPACVFG